MICRHHLLTALLAAAAALAAGCSTLAIATAPAKEAKTDDSPAAKEAEALFWSIFRGGRYDDIAAGLDKLKAAYVAQPSDPTIAAHIAWLHSWRVSERARLAKVSPSITDDVLLSRRYFDEAVKLHDADARYTGARASLLMSEGAVQHDEKLTRIGYFAMKDAVAQWPEYNLFTRGYTMSSLPVTDERFRDAVDDHWSALDRCAGQKVDRRAPDYAPFMHLETRSGAARACWNSWLAPHNFEGFFLSLGDMLTKAGDPALSRRVYAQAKLSRGYATWPYREVLERRISQADDNVQLFRQPTVRAGGDKERQMMKDSAFACMACHQQ